MYRVRAPPHRFTNINEYYTPSIKCTAKHVSMYFEIGLFMCVNVAVIFYIFVRHDQITFVVSVQRVRGTADGIACMN